MTSPFVSVENIVALYSLRAFFYRYSYVVVVNETNTLIARKIVRGKEKEFSLT